MRFHLTNAPLFRGMTPEEIDALLSCLNAKARACKKGEIILIEGAPTEQLGVVLSGMVIIEMSDVWGNNSVLSSVAPCSHACACHAGLIRNLLTLCAGKNLQLSRRMMHTSPKRIRTRLLSYFSECIKRSGSYAFDIPYNRQQLADYLNVERSALSNELSLMRQDGILRYDKNHFVVSETADMK